MFGRSLCVKFPRVFDSGQRLRSTKRYLAATSPSPLPFRTATTGQRSGVSRRWALKDGNEVVCGEVIGSEVVWGRTAISTLRPPTINFATASPPGQRKRRCDFMKTRQLTASSPSPSRQDGKQCTIQSDGNLSHGMVVNIDLRFPFTRDMRVSILSRCRHTAGKQGQKTSGWTMGEEKKE